MNAAEKKWGNIYTFTLIWDNKVVNPPWPGLNPIQGISEYRLDFNLQLGLIWERTARKRAPTATNYDLYSLNGEILEASGPKCNGEDKLQAIHQHHHGLTPPR